MENQSLWIVMVVYHMNNEKGFTLLELLIVLAITALVSLFILPSMYKSVARQEQHHFFELLESDTFYIQNQTLFTTKQHDITFTTSKYFMNSSTDKKERSYPEQLRNTYNPNRIIFSQSGTIRNPATYYFDYEYGKYKLTFPFGKGRSYLEEI